MIPRAVVLVCLLAAPLCAQQPVLSLTLADAEKIALQNNPRLPAARYTAEAAYQVPHEYRSALLPSVSGLLTGVGADSGSRLAAGGLNNPVVYDRIASGLSAHQLVADFGRTRNLVASSRLSAEAQDQATEGVRAELLAATATAYFGVLRAHAVLTVAEQTVSARQLVADQVTALANSQLKSALDVSFANVNLADARLLLSQAQNGVKAAEAELGSALGVPLQTVFALKEEPAPGPLDAEAETFVRLAIEGRPELKELRLQQSAAERLIKAEHALFYPTVEAAAVTGLVPAGEAQIPGRYGAIGINVNVPVFNGGLFRARQTEAELKAKAAHERLNDLANRLTRDVRVAYLEARTSYERVGLSDQLLKQSQLAMDLARGRYDLGLSSIVELSQAQLNLTSAQIAVAAARYDYQAKRTALDYQSGSLR